jgi:hypothetical protein
VRISNRKPGTLIELVFFDSLNEQRRYFLGALNRAFRTLLVRARSYALDAAIAAIVIRFGTLCDGMRVARRKLRFVSRVPSSALFRRGVVKDREEQKRVLRAAQGDDQRE